MQKILNECMDSVIKDRSTTVLYRKIVKREEVVILLWFILLQSLLGKTLKSYKNTSALI